MQRPYWHIAVSNITFFTLLFLGLNLKNFAQNPIITENLLTGNPSSEWDITGAGDLSIQGFATDLSVDNGTTVSFKINVTDGAQFNVKIYRLGYYNGAGARLITNLGDFTGTIQPSPLTESSTGLVDCGNWSVSVSWPVPANAVPGIYLAKLTRTGNGGASHIAFVVRDDNSTADILFQTSDATWQAYNVYGGNSLYVGSTSYPAGHAAKVSYNRPFLTRNGGGGSSSSEDWLFHAEYPMIRWLERNGYYLNYATNIDAARNPNLLQNHKVFLSVGHDEYWSKEQRDNITAARNNGKHLAFFSGNEIYWKTRWENSIDGSNTPWRTLVCYKEGTLGENSCGNKCDPNPAWTGLWRDGCNPPYATNDACLPENSLSGQISWVDNTSAIQVPFAYKNLRLWRNTSITSLTSGQTATFSAGTLGYEWNAETPAYANHYPNGRILLSETNAAGKTHKLSLYKHSSGAWVFGAGTVQWSWGLDAVHDGSASVEDQRMQQATVNLFADMGVQPGSMQSGLIAATASTDNTSPVSSITSPTHGSSYNANNTITISGTASDAGGGIVAGVEVSVDGGTTWRPATGTNNWTFSWTTPTTPGTYNVKCRGFDDSGNMEASGTAPSANAITVTINPAVCPCTVFSPADVPASTNNIDNTTGIEIGFKFKSSVNGFITGIRFYKGTLSTGTHTGHLWTTSGTSLGSVVFTGETGSGWQQATFGSPIAITANTTYIASYHSTTGHYSLTNPFFTTDRVNGPLTGLENNGVNGPNGLYLYTATPAFPTQNYQTSNYWVDVVFETTVGPDITPPVVSSTSPTTNASNISVSTTITATFNEPLDALTVTSSTVMLKDASNATVSATLNYESANRRIAITPSSNLNNNTVYTITLKGGTTDPRLKDVAGNALAADYIWSFTTQSPPPPPPNEGPGGPILVISKSTNPFSRYPVEILRAQGLNAFYAMDISVVNATVLNNYDVVILGEMALATGEVTMFTNWVNAGGTLITLKPDAQLSGLLGITSAGGTLSDKYLLVNTASGPGTGIVNQTIQFHSTADLYTLNGATALATLYSSSTTATTNPAVTLRNVGSNGGQAIAFTYDLAKSIVYTRQGNPAWAGQSRDGQPGPIRSDNLFFGLPAGAGNDWIDFNKVAIPQADEQMQLLTNIIIKGNSDKKPLPRFWFLPKGLKAAVVMTGDDHGNGGTIARFNQYKTLSGANDNSTGVADWLAIRGSSYIYPNTPINNTQVTNFQNDGFDIGLHLNTGCANFTESSLLNDWSIQWSQMLSNFPGILPQTTHRTHCVAWNDWATQAKVQANRGVRLDVNYYYWPESWMQNRVGMFTGSGMPMRFADLDGSLIDCYQVTTQMTDETNMNYTSFCNQLLDNAIGANGYYGVFATNMHTDANTSAGSDAIIASAQARNIPVVSAKQMLEWVDGRNNSTFSAINWSSNQLSFTITAASGSRNIKAMLPRQSNNGTLSSLSFNGSAHSYTTETIKGIEYIFFNAPSGNYIASYTVDATPPVITNIVATPNNNGTATITWTTNEPATSIVNYGLTTNTLNLNATNTTLMTSHSVILTGLLAATTYYFTVTSNDAANNSATAPVPPATLSFTMPPGPCAADATSADFNLGTTDANTIIVPSGDGAVSLKPAMNEEFSGAGVPTGWTNAIWDAQAGAATTFNSGQVSVDGTHLNYNTTVGPGTSLEFRAMFTAGNFQNIGFTGDANFNTPWIVIGRGGAGDNNVYARTNSGQVVSLGSSLLDAMHTYRIQWLTGTNSFEFYVDGVLVPTAAITQTVSTNMVIQISDYPAGGVALSVDWIRATPYATPGTFFSRVFDAGNTTSTWGAVNWNASTPANTSLTIFVRKGNTPTPDASWSAFTQVTNGGNAPCGPNRYIQYKAVLTTSDPSVTPMLNDITIACGASADVTAPVISNVVVTPNSSGNGTALITWVTDEAATSVVKYGTVSTNLNLTSTDPALVLNHSITLTGLTLGTYFYRVESADCSNNNATGSVNSFVIPHPTSTCFQDVVTADFSQGTTGTTTYISPKNDGEVILKPTVGEQFSGSSLPAGWGSFGWTGGTSTVSGGSVTVDGARCNTVPETTTYGPGSSMEFSAVFGAGSFQHIGFGGGTDAAGTGGIYNGNDPWAMFSTGNTNTNLKARVSPSTGTYFDIDIPGSGPYLGTAHIYRIQWNASNFEFYIDGVLVHTQNTTISSTMRPAISDYNNGGAVISVDWMNVSPYPATGTYVSRIYDAGELKNWGTVTWTSDIPSGTTLQIFQRKANSSTNILTAAWVPVASSGTNIGGTSQFIQYKAEFTTSNSAVTPALKDISFSCSKAQTISGNVWHDVNGLTDFEVNNSGGGSAAPLPIPLFVYLVNASTNLIEKVTLVSPSGTFNFTNITPGTLYYVYLSSDGVNVGNPPPAPTLPTGWIHSGQNLGAGIGNDFIPQDGRLTIPPTSVDVINANFGIQLGGDDFVIG